MLALQVAHLPGSRRVFFAIRVLEDKPVFCAMQSELVRVVPGNSGGAV
jgi:hypothetical protein